MQLHCRFHPIPGSISRYGLCLPLCPVLLLPSRAPAVDGRLSRRVVRVPTDNGLRRLWGIRPPAARRAVSVATGSVVCCALGCCTNGSATSACNCWIRASMACRFRSVSERDPVASPLRLSWSFAAAMATSERTVARRERSVASSCTFCCTFCSVCADLRLLTRARDWIVTAAASTSAMASSLTLRVV